MSKLDIRSIRRKYLKSKKSDEVLKGCFHKDDLKKISNMLWEIRMVNING